MTEVHPHIRVDEHHHSLRQGTAQQQRCDPLAGADVKHHRPGPARPVDFQFGCSSLPKPVPDQLHHRVGLGQLLQQPPPVASPELLGRRVGQHPAQPGFGQ
jgi:hypothetical protein